MQIFLSEHKFKFVNFFLSWYMPASFHSNRKLGGNRNKSTLRIICLHEAEDNN